MRDVRTVLVVGAGTMGHGIAQSFAANGLTVYLADQKEEFVTRGKGWIRDNLEYMVSLGELAASEVEPILSRVHPTTDMAGAAAKAAGNAVNSSTITKISQTWFASHTGPMARSIAARCAALRGPRASRSSTPPPKSAPPKIA